jgi:hypothetical protein
MTQVSDVAPGPLVYLFVCLFLLITECLCLPTLAFYNEQRTWNEAYSICVKNGGFLVTVDSTNKYNMISDFSTQAPWNLVSEM